MPDPWVKVEDFVNETKQLAHRYFASGVQYIMGWEFVHSFFVSNLEVHGGVDIKKAGDVYMRYLQRGVLAIQEQIEQVMLPRIPEVAEPYQFRGEKIHFYISKHVPQGKPIFMIHPEDWHHKYAPAFWHDTFGLMVKLIEHDKEETARLNKKREDAHAQG